MSPNIPKISVVIPVKNEEETIQECIKGVFSQTIRPYEILVIDGNSTDGTIERVKEFPVKILLEDYGSVGGARQVGLENAKGNYIAYTDADCIPEKNWLEHLTKGFDQNIVGVGGSLTYVGNRLWEKSIALIMNTKLGSANSVQGRIFKEKRFVKSIPGCNCLYRREDLISVGGFNVNLSINEDTELNRRLTKIGKILYSPNAMVVHTQKRGLKEFSKRMYQFGFGRGQLRLWDLQCIPPVFALVLFCSLIFSLWPLVIVMCTYIAILFSMGLKFTILQKVANYLLTIPIVYFSEHVSYSMGFLMGLLRIKRFQ